MKVRAGGANEEEDGGGVDEETAEEENQERFELDLKFTSTGKRTHAFTIGENRFYSKGIKKSGASYFYCNYISGKERCTSRIQIPCPISQSRKSDGRRTRD